MATFEHNTPSLTALRVLATVGRFQSISLAAQELGISKSAVSQHLSKLESQLATKLFVRGSNSFQLTEEGRFYLADLRRAFELIDDATERLALRQRQWLISCTPTFAECWLIPRLASLQSVLKRPVRVIASPQRANFVEDGVDIAIRQANPPFSVAHRAHLLLQRDWLLVCRHDVYDAYTQAWQTEQWQHLTFIGDSHHFETLLPELAPMLARAQQLRFSTAALSLHACLQGLGMCLMDRFFIQDALNHSVLKVLQAYPQYQHDAFYLLYDQHKPPEPDVLAWFLEQN